MDDWTARVTAAATSWVYVPDDAPSVLVDEFALVGYPPSFGLPTQVSRIRSTTEASDLVARVELVASGWDRTEVAWWIDPATTPVDLEQHLQDAGAELAETVTVLAVDLTRPLPDFAVPDGVTASVATGPDALRDFGRVNATGWESEEPTDDDLARWATDDSIRVLGAADGVPCATGGMTLVDGVARLWAGVTLPEFRGRGGYRAVLAERLRVAREHGATIGLVKGRVTTSAPILRRLGFDVFDDERAYRKVTAAGDGNSATAS